MFGTFNCIINKGPQLDVRLEDAYISAHSENVCYNIILYKFSHIHMIRFHRKYFLQSPMKSKEIKNNVK